MTHPLPSEPDLRQQLAISLTVLLGDRWTELDRFMAAVDEYTSRLPLRPLDAEIARRRAPDYQWFPKPNDNQTPTQRAGNAGARGMQHGELTGLVIARELVRAALAAASPEPARDGLRCDFDCDACRADHE